MLELLQVASRTWSGNLPSIALPFAPRNRDVAYSLTVVPCRALLTKETLGTLSYLSCNRSWRTSSSTTLWSQLTHVSYSMHLMLSCLICA